MATPGGSSIQPANVQIFGVNDVRDCKRVMEAILDERRTIAVDAEGLSLSKTGRLTLLQFGKMDGSVFLIDVIDPHQHKSLQKGKELLIIGKVKDVLESSLVEKVMQGCFHDSAALYHQFGIKLNNVFDTQMAHVTLEQEVENLAHPRKLRLDLLVKKYTGVDHNSADMKDVFEEKPNFWEERPLTEEMKKYAAEDVHVLPGLYNELKRRIEKSRLWSAFRLAVQEELLNDIEPERSRDLKYKRNLRNQLKVLDRMQKGYSAYTLASDFSEDERNVLRHIPGGSLGWKKKNAQIRAWELKVCHYDLDEWKKEMRENGGGLRVNSFNMSRLERLSKHPDPEIAMEAKRLRMMATLCEKP